MTFAGRAARHPWKMLKEIQRPTYCFSFVREDWSPR
jgi:hypothetical protein